MNSVQRLNLCVLLGAGLAGSWLGAAEYHVDATRGSDERTPAQAQVADTPWATIGRAAAAVQAGDTVLVHAGTYAPGIVVSAQGTAEKPIVFRAVGDVILRNARELPKTFDPLAGSTDIWSVEDPGPVTGVFENPETFRCIIELYRPVISLDALRKTTGPMYFFDAAAKRLYLKPLDQPLDPAKKKLLVARTDIALSAEGAHTVFEGFRVEFTLRAVVLGGHDNTARRIWAYQCGDAVTCAGPQSTVEFCVVQACFSGINAGPQCEIRNNTIYGTRVPGLGFGDKLNGQIVNNLVWAGGVSGPTAGGLPGPGMVMDYNLWGKFQNHRGRLAIAWGSGKMITSLEELRATGFGHHDLNLEPLFVSTEPGKLDLHLQSRRTGFAVDSPCLNAGTPAGTHIGAFGDRWPIPPAAKPAAAPAPVPAPATAQPTKPVAGAPATHDPTSPAKYPAWQTLGKEGMSPGVCALATDGTQLFALGDNGVTATAADGTVAEILPSSRTTGMHALHVTADSIWLGGTTGVVRIDRKSGQTQPWQPQPVPEAYDRVLFDAEGQVYVFANSAKTLRVYDATGASRWQVTRIYDLPDTLTPPAAVARRASGDIYLADAENNRILIFTADGQFKRRVPDNFCRPHGLVSLPGDRLAVLCDYTERMDAPLITILDARDNPVADWVSDTRVLPTNKPVFFSYILGYYQKMGETPVRPKESLSPLSCAVFAGNRLVVAQATAGSVRTADVAVFEPRKKPAQYPARLRREFAKEIKGKSASYTINVGGTLDWRNTTRSNTHSGYTLTPLFMVDDSYTLVNTGTTPVVNPHFSINGQGDYFDAAHIEQAIVPPKAKLTNLEKAFSIYNFVRRNLAGTNWVASGTGLQSQYYMFDWWGIRTQGVHLTSKWNNFGAPGACGCYSAYVAKFAHDLGFQARNGGVVGHCPSFVIVDGQDVYLDAIMRHSNRDPVTGLFCPRIDDQGLAGYEDLVKDQYLVMRVAEFNADLATAACFGARERHKFEPYEKPPKWVTWKDTSKMALTLRPGEAITRRTAYLGRSAIEPAMQMDAVVNGDIVYHPNLADGTYKLGAASEANVAVVKGELHATAPDAHVAFAMACPHPLLTGWVELKYRRANAADELEADLNIDGKGWQRIWRASQTGDATEMIYLWPLDQLRDTDEREWPLPAFAYAVRFRLKTAQPGPGLAIRDVSIGSLFQTFYQAIPRLQVGANKVAYEDETPGPHRLRLIHRWKESSFGQEPQPPAAPLFPAPDATVHGYEFTFKWQPGTDPHGEGIADYEWEVSKRPDFLWPVAPNFSMYTRGKTEEPVPEYSLLSDGVTYYWHVRCQNKRGVWGPWSKTWKFTTVGPRVPTDVKIRQEGQTWVLSWKPNPNGTRPARYEIFADIAPGFVPVVTTRRMFEENYRKPFDKPSNIILTTTTDQTEAVVVSERLEKGDRCFFRVAAIDADGARSGPSGYAEAKHPFLFTAPVTTAKVGENYRYQAKSLLSIGEFSLGSGGNDRPHQETLRFRLDQAPAWLSVNAETGLLTGTPAQAGDVPVKLIVSNGRGAEDMQSFVLNVK